MQAESGTEERRLVRESQDGSAAAMAQLYSLHWRGAYRAAYLVVHDAAAAEDIAQEAFLAAVDGLDRFDRRRPFRPWLHRIVVTGRSTGRGARRCAGGSTGRSRSSRRCRRPRRSATR